MTEQKPTAEAVRVANDAAPVVEGMAGMFTCLWCKWTWDNNEEPSHDPACPTHAIATLITAKDVSQHGIC